MPKLHSKKSTTDSESKRLTEACNQALNEERLAQLGTIGLMRAVEKFGLSRTLLFDLCLTGKVKSYLIKKHPNSRGVRLIEVASLLEYIKKQGGA